MDFSNLLKHCKLEQSHSYFFFFTQDKTTRLSAISSHCLVALPAKMSAFNSDMRQNAYYRNLKRTFADLLPCYCYVTKIEQSARKRRVLLCRQRSRQSDRSELQAHHYMTCSNSCAVQVSYSNVASPKFGGSKMFDFRRITLFCLGYRLSKHKICSRNYGGHGPPGVIPANKLSLQELN